jgi:uncharacterized RDD family membrane protein YckC
MSEVEPGAAGTPSHGGDPLRPRMGAVPHRLDALPVEARPFQGQRAGIVTRTAANVIDFLLVVFVLACGYAAWCAFTFLINPAHFRFPAPSFAILLVCFGIALFAYFTMSWATTGRTYGDHQLGLRVVNSRGEPLGWPRSVIRAGFCVLLPIGLYWSVVSPTNRSVQDSVLRTSVVYDWAIMRRPPEPITSSG